MRSWSASSSIGLAEKDCEHGCLFDGFPRTVPQAEALDRMLAERRMPLDLVLALDVAEPQLVDRLLARGRPDDDLETIRERFRQYHRLTQPLLEYYSGRGVLRQIAAEGTPDEVFAKIRSAVDAASPLRFASRRRSSDKIIGTSSFNHPFVSLAVIQLKSEREIALMRQAGICVWQAHQLVRQVVAPGVTTAEIDAVITEHFRLCNAEPLFKDYPHQNQGRPAFPAATCTSVNEEVVHGIPTHRQLRRRRCRQRRHRLPAQRLVRRFGLHVPGRPHRARLCSNCSMSPKPRSIWRSS